MIQVKSHLRKTKRGRTGVRRHYRRSHLLNKKLVEKLSVAEKERIILPIKKKVDDFQKRSRQEHYHMDIYLDFGIYGSEHYTIGINWAGIGTVGLEETDKFIRNLQEARKIVKEAIETGIVEVRGGI